MAGDFDISRYKDRYRQQLMGVIRKKARGQRIEVPDAPKTEAAPDLMEALRASLDGTGGSRGKGGGSKKAPRSRSCDGGPRRPGSRAARRWGAPSSSGSSQPPDPPSAFP
jgi:hypothetical protein